MDERQQKIALARTRRLLEVIPQVEAAVQDGVPADRWLSAFFREHRQFGAKDRRLLSDAVFAYFRWRGRVAPNEGEWAHALWQALTHEAFADQEILACLGGPGPGEGTGSPVDQWVPEWVMHHLVTPPEQDAEIYFESFQRRPPTWIRLDRKHPAHERPDVEIDPRWPMAGRLAGAISRSAAQSEFYEIQDLASQCVGLIAAPKPEQRWWDVCAGAGGKTLHLADLMEGRGAIVATEPRESVLQDVLRRAKRHGVDRMIQTITCDSLGYTPELPFDGVLVDAPCSGLGTWSRSPDARWRLQESRIAELAGLQKRLLDHAAAQVKDGGVLVYSVCTATRAETEAQADRFMVEHHDFTAESFTHPIDGSTARGRAWIFPWDGPCGGMFIARWRKAAR